MNKLKWLLIIVIIIAAFLRLYNITETPPGLYPDEAMNGNNALEKFSVFYPENNGREGLFIDIQALSLKFFMSVTASGPEPWMLRVVSALFGIFTVLGVYFLTKELFKNNELGIKNYGDEKFKHNSLFIIHNSNIIALFSAFLLATSFWHINFSRIGFRAIMAPFFIVWGIYFLLRSLNKIIPCDQTDPNAVQLTGQRAILFSVIGGILYGLGMHSYIAYRATPLLILIILFLYWVKNKKSAVRKKIILSTCYFLLATVVAFAPLVIYFLQNPADFFGRTTQVSVFSSPTTFKDLGNNILKTAAMFNFTGDENWRHNLAGAPQLFWPVGILFLIGIFVGLRMFFEKMSRRPSGHGVSRSETSEAESQAASERLGERDRGFRKEHPQAIFILFSWLIIAALPVVISNEGMPHALRATLMIPPAVILAAAGGIWLYEWVKDVMTRHSNILVFKIFTLIFLSLLIFEAYTTYFIKWGQSQHTQGAFAADYVAMGRELNSLPKEMPKYVIVEARGVDVRGLPMPTQTVMFITDTFTPEKQKEKNIHYVLPNQINEIPKDSYIVILK